MENFQLELPRDTLIEVEIVQELRGEVSSDKKIPGKIFTSRRLFSLFLSVFVG